MRTLNKSIVRHNVFRSVSAASAAGWAVAEFKVVILCSEQHFLSAPQKAQPKIKQELDIRFCGCTVKRESCWAGCTVAVRQRAFYSLFIHINPSFNNYCQHCETIDQPSCQPLDTTSRESTTDIDNPVVRTKTRWNSIVVVVVVALL